MSTEPLPDPVIESTIESTIAADAQPAAEAIAVVGDFKANGPEPVASTEAAVGARIGRYTHADLLAMVGKRGRKPPEFYAVFPRESGAALVSKPSSAGTKKTRGPRAKTLPAVSSAVIGEHTIDELLAMIGSTGRKPVAFDILQQSAQVFADAKAIDLPTAPVDPLVTAFAAAPKGVREAITALLAATKKR